MDVVRLFLGHFQQYFGPLQQNCAEDLLPEWMT